LRKFYIYFLIPLLISACRNESPPEPPNASGTVYYSQVIGTTRSDLVTSVIQSNDGTILVCGYTIQSAFGDNDIFVIKTSISGEILWANLYGGSGNDLAYSSALCLDGGYIICGATNSFSGNFNPYVIKIDRDGNVLWSKYYDWAMDDYGTHIIQTSDYGYMMTGYTMSHGQGEYDVFSLKLDQNGGVMFAKAYGSLLNDFGNVIIETYNQSYIIGGYSYSFGAFGDACIIKLYGDGNLHWARVYGGGGLDVIYDLKVNNYTNSYIACGMTNSFTFSDDDAFIIDINTNANINWLKTYNGTGNVNDYFSNILPVSGGLVAFGSINNGTDTDISFLRTNTSGNIISGKFFGGDGTDIGSSVRSKINGGYIIAGITASSGAGDNDIFIAAVSEDGSGCNENNTLNATVTSRDFNVIEPLLTVSPITSYGINTAPTNISSFNVNQLIQCRRDE
jgi:hypothetical protein